MITFYVHNFRGFKHTFLPLASMVFFVGENSTGKTSLLKLIGIISKPQFWNTFEFPDDLELDLGHFSEMVSSESEERYFEVGVSATVTGSVNKFAHFLARFIPDKERPKLAWLRVCTPPREIAFRRSADGFFEVGMNEEVNDADFQGWAFQDPFIGITWRKILIRPQDGSF